MIEVLQQPLRCLANAYWNHLSRKSSLLNKATATVASIAEPVSICANCLENAQNQYAVRGDAWESIEACGNRLVRSEPPIYSIEMLSTDRSCDGLDTTFFGLHPLFYSDAPFQLRNPRLVIQIAIGRMC